MNLKEERKKGENQGFPLCEATHATKPPVSPSPFHASCACGRGSEGYIGPASPVVEAGWRGAADRWVPSWVKIVEKQTKRITVANENPWENLKHETSEQGPTRR